MGMLSFGQFRYKFLNYDIYHCACSNECSKHGVYRPIQRAKVARQLSRENSCEEYRKAKNILEIFGGNTRVIFYLSETKEQLLAPQSLWTTPNPTMLGELSFQLGEENVILK